MRPRAAAQLVVLSLLAHLSLLSIVAAYAGAFSIALSFWAIVVFIPPALIAAMLPISIAGWGVRESGFVAMLYLVDVAPTDAVLLALGMGIMQLGQGLFGGIVWLTSGGRSSVKMMGDSLSD